MATLTILTGPSAGTRFPLLGNRPIVIGRDGVCDLVLSHSTVSRQHARIFSRGGQYFIEDLNSVNGTFVNGRRVSRPALLKSGDRINIYEVVSVFEASADANVRATSQSTTDPEVLTDSGRIAVPTGRFKPSGDDALATNRAAARQVHVIFDVVRQLGSTLDLDSILPKVLDSLFQFFPQTSNGDVLLLDTVGRLIPVASRRGRDDDSHPRLQVPVDNDLARQSLNRREGIVAVEGDESDISFEFRSIMCAPIVGPSQCGLGVVHLETDDPLARFTSDDLQLLFCISTVAGQAIEYTRAHQSEVELHRRHDELRHARRIQKKMLPRRCPQVAGYAFSDRYQPAGAVGGDYFTYLTLSDGRLVVVVADVCGKGLAAALTVAQLSTEVRHVLEVAPTIHGALQRLNQYAMTNGELMVTLLILILDPWEHRLTILNAGHPHPLLRKASDGTTQLIGEHASGFPLGIQPDSDYHETSIMLDPGDSVLVITDGVTDTQSRSGERFRHDRLASLFHEKGFSPRDFVRSLASELDSFTNGAEQKDDICVVCLQRMSDAASVPAEDDSDSGSSGNDAIYPVASPG